MWRFPFATQKPADMPRNAGGCFDEQIRERSRLAELEAESSRWRRMYESKCLELARVQRELEKRK